MAKVETTPLEPKSVSEKLKAYIVTLSKLPKDSEKNLEWRIENLNKQIKKWASAFEKAEPKTKACNQSRFALMSARRALWWHLEAKKLQSK